MMATDSVGMTTIGRDEMEEWLFHTVNKGEELTLLVTGYSMVPFLSHLKDRVTLVSPDKYEIKKLDIVLFQRTDGRYVLHRVIRCGPKDTYVINGDSQVFTEEVCREQICAVVKEIRKGRRKISCRGKTYRCCAAVWVWLKPVRGIGINAYRRMRRGFIGGKE